MKRIFKIVINILLFMGLVSCTQITDLSQQEPYKTAIGKQFVLQKDMYIYQFNDAGSSLRIGDINNMPNPSALNIPKVVNEKYVGIKGPYITLRGIAKKGTLFTIKNIIKKQTFEDLYYIYNITISNGDYFDSNQEINSSDILNLLQNPPDTATWSDPPIFKAEYALPLPSDRVWWK